MSYTPSPTDPIFRCTRLPSHSSVLVAWTRLGHRDEIDLGSNIGTCLIPQEHPCPYKHRQHCAAFGLQHIGSAASVSEKFPYEAR